MRIKKWMPALTGVIIGIMALLLTELGNPANMGFCIACFIRDTAGALGLHQAAPVQYVRPEIVGIVFGAFVLSLITKEFKPSGGSSPAIRFFIGAAVMMGALTFLGCPLRMAIRIGGGDLNAVVGLIGFALGIGAGVLALKRGFTLGRAYAQKPLEGYIFPIICAVLLAVYLLFPALFASSEAGPGSMRAPLIIALAAGIAVGALCQRSRFCMAGGIRDTLMFRDTTLLWGLVGVIATVAAGNLILGKFNPGFEGQPIAHTQWLWNLLGMAVVGWGSALLGGCPLRQFVLAGQGNSDSAVTVLGFLTGAALSHNLKIAASADGAGANSPAAVVICLVFLTVVTVMHVEKTKGN